MTLATNPSSLWLTINPCNLHDPMAQLFAGQDIDLDRFVATAGPYKEDRAINIANDPYASVLFFKSIITLVLETLFGVRASDRKITREKGVLGFVIASVESQNRGSLYAHMLLWLVDAPTNDEMSSRRPSSRSASCVLLSGVELIKQTNDHGIQIGRKDATAANEKGI